MRRAAHRYFALTGVRPARRAGWMNPPYSNYAQARAGNDPGCAGHGPRGRQEAEGFLSPDHGRRRAVFAGKEVAMDGKEIEKARELFDAKIQFVSLVDAAANRRKFLAAKARDGTRSFESYGRILKAEAHYVTGIVYEPMTEDTDGEFMTAEEIRKAAYYYVKNFECVDVQHSFEPEKGCAVVESWIAKADFNLGGQDVREGSWLMTVEVSDEALWGKIEKGEITGFSMGGICKTGEEEVDLEDVRTEKATEEKKGLLQKLAGFLGISAVEKGKVREAYEKSQKDAGFRAAFETLDGALRRYDTMTDKLVYEQDEEAVKAALEDFRSIITGLLTGEEPLAKAIVTKEEVTDVTKEELMEAVEAAVAKAMKQKEAVQGQSEEAVRKAEDIPSMEELVKKAMEEAAAAQAEAIKAAVEEQVAKAMEPVLKANHLPSNLNHETVTKEAAGEHYLHGIL